MKLKIIPFFFIAILYLTSHNLRAQSFSWTYFFYSLPSNGSLGEEKIEFSFNGSILKVKDHLTNNQSEYGPLKLLRSQYIEKGYYLFRFGPNYVSDLSRGFDFIFDKKGGELLFVREISPNSSSQITYYTKRAYQIESGSMTSTSERAVFEKHTSELDLSKIIIKSNSLDEIKNKINYAFTSESDKRLSENNKMYGVDYKYFQNGESFVSATVIYTLDNKIDNIQIFLPNYMISDIKRDFSLFNSVEVNANPVMDNEYIYKDLKIHFGSANKVGMIIIGEN